MGEAEVEHPKIMPTGRQRCRLREPRCCGPEGGEGGGFPGGLRMSTWQGKKRRTKRMAGDFKVLSGVTNTVVQIYS